MTILTGTRSLTAIHSGKQTVAHKTAAGWLVTLSYVDLGYALPTEFCFDEAQVRLYCEGEGFPSPFIESKVS